jgi:hypothetical protein
LGKRAVVVPYLLMAVAVGIVTGCARDVVILDPRTGETTTCRASPLNPWSQQDACVGDYIAHGWRRVE